MLTYKGYRAIVKYDNEAEMLYGEVVSTRDVITFQASSVEQLKRELKFSIDDYLAFCAEKGIEPPPSTEYRIIDGQVLVPDSAANRKGIQPVVSLAVNGGERAEVTA